MQGILISIAGTKGGVGKTLTIAHFLKRLQEMNKSVAVISHHSNDLPFLFTQSVKSENSILDSKSYDLLKVPHGDRLASIKSKYDVILNEVSKGVDPFEDPIVRQSDSYILLGTSEPLSNFLLKQQFSFLLKSNPQHFHIVFNRLNFSNEYDFLVKKIKGWSTEGLSTISTSYIPEDQALLDDLMRKDVFHSNYLQRISGQSWRQLLESILRQQNSNPLSRSRAA